MPSTIWVAIPAVATIIVALCRVAVSSRRGFSKGLGARTERIPVAAKTPAAVDLALDTRLARERGGVRLLFGREQVEVVVRRLRLRRLGSLRLRRRLGEQRCLTERKEARARVEDRRDGDEDGERDHQFLC